MLTEKTEGKDEEEGVAQEGFVGKRRAVELVMRERSWSFSGMSEGQKVTPGLDLWRRCSASNATPRGQYFSGRGELRTLSPKHQELVGLGIEYS